MAQQLLQLSEDDEVELELFLIYNDVLQEWRDIFHTDSDLKSSLFKCVKVLNDVSDTIPRYCDIFRAFLLCSPQDIKVVIIGHDPIPNMELASGVSFSYPERKKLDENVGHKRPALQGEGRSIAILDDVLVKAGFLESGGTYSYCHEQWAEKGVLLLNASLTYHLDIWDEFIKEILLHVAKNCGQKPLFFLFWGTSATTVGTWLSSTLRSLRYPAQTIQDGDHRESIDEGAPLVLFIGDHPTWPRDYNMYEEQALNQFRAIKTIYPDLFTLPNLACLKK